MIAINSRTKIASVLKERPDALEAIISLSPHFKKLRNPLLRKVMASRATIQMACSLGGCQVQDFFEKLRPFGFETSTSSEALEMKKVAGPPSFIRDLAGRQVEELDVRASLENGRDPFKIISEKIKQLKPGHVLKLINNFEPVPLIELLGKQGFESYVEHVDENCVATYFNKKIESAQLTEVPLAEPSAWENRLQHFDGKLQFVDVRNLEMPLPMFTILEELNELQDETALFVYHKRVPVFLIPELRERGFDFLIREISDTEVHLLIFRPI